jgi:glycosyltransferase involved in cell wall biosynthesis
MSPRDPQGQPRPSAADRPRRAILLTCYDTGATRGKNLGTPGYSYDIVAKLFTPLLERWGEVIRTPRDSRALNAAAEDARRRGFEPVHVSFVPFQDFRGTTRAANVIVPAWEFPDVPDAPFDGNPLNDWAAASAECDLVIVGGPYTVETFQRGGIRKPIHVVPVPTPESYFKVPRWRYHASVLLGCSAYVFQHSGDADAPAPTAAPATLTRRLRNFIRTRMRLGYRRFIKPLVPPVVHQSLRSAARVLIPRLVDPFGREHQRRYLDLSGVVYTSIFNPADGRKNWEDLLSGFVKALGDCPDATLVLKLIARDPTWAERVAQYYRCLDHRHRCRVIFVTEYLSEQQMLALAQATTYYITTTRAEGNCLPVMNYLAAGRPVISTCHTAISDYFTDQMGFVLESHPEPAIWPHDSSLRFKTTWARLVWPSLLETLRHSYEIARDGHPAYEAMAGQGQDKIRHWGHPEVVWERLKAALDEVDAMPQRARQAA